MLAHVTAASGPQADPKLRFSISVYLKANGVDASSAATADGVSVRLLADERGCLYIALDRDGVPDPEGQLDLSHFVQAGPRA